MKNISITSLIFCCLIAISCSEQRQHFTPLSENASILAFGDSLTAGKGATISQSYPAVLQQLSQRNVINAGISGEISANGLKRLPGLLEKYRPELVIICHGGNDILRRISSLQTKSNIIEMIRLAKSYNAQVLLLAVPKPTLLVPPAEVYFEIAKSTAVELDSDTMPATLKSSKLKSDTYHPNAAGYHYIASQVFSRLSNLGAF
ncbi:MAG: GDSL-type esterase/lipase family protein [Gammaproteobacteria bacterium]|nr:GDSL-type esterase/lipase family protein [Gammaproteobacteria bacterium]